MIIFQFADAISPEQLNMYTVFFANCVRNVGIEINGVAIFRSQHFKEQTLRPMTMDARCCKVLVSNYSKMKSAEDIPVPPLRGK